MVRLGAGRLVTARAGIRGVHHRQPRAPRTGQPPLVPRTLPQLPATTPGTAAPSAVRVKEPSMSTDPTIVRIGEAVELHHGRGQRDAARLLFAEIWDEIGGEQGDPLHVCVLAHSMADV